MFVEQKTGKKSVLRKTHSVFLSQKHMMHAKAIVMFDN